MECWCKQEGLLQKVVFQAVPRPGGPADTGPSARHWPAVCPLLERQVVPGPGGPADTGPSACHWPVVGLLLERQVVELMGRGAW